MRKEYSKRVVECDEKAEQQLHGWAVDLEHLQEDIMQAVLDAKRTSQLGASSSHGHF